VLRRRHRCRRARPAEDRRERLMSLRAADAAHVRRDALPLRHRRVAGAPSKARDKAKVEAGELVAERWILARLRDQTFYSLSELNARIAELLQELNARVMRHYRASRRELFERLDKPALKALPADRFVFGEWKLCKLNIDYHFE